jgi:GntR family transcriptional regulator
LNSTSPTSTTLAPHYFRLAEALRSDIETGRWGSGDQIPTEQELGLRHGVSRTVVRQAVGMLVTSGLLRRVQGRGTFVASPRVRQDAHRFRSFTADMRSRRLTPDTKLLSAELVPANSEIAERLWLSQGDPIWEVTRLRLADGKPMGLQTAYLPARVCPDLAIDRLEKGSLYSLLLEQFGIVPKRANETYIAVSLTKEDARLLDTRDGAAGLAVERITSDATGRVFEYVRSVMRGDRYQISLELEAEE